VSLSTIVGAEAQQIPRDVSAVCQMPLSHYWMRVAIHLGNTCEKAILETTISGSNTCLTNPKDVYRTCFQRAIDPSNSLTEDAILRNIGPHTAPYIAEDEELNHETVYLSLVRSNTAQLTCDDELELEEIALEWLKVRCACHFHHVVNI
jgi:hypothetical protein